jgi:hypothetical protein
MERSDLSDGGLLSGFDEKSAGAPNRVVAQEERRFRKNYDERC